MAPRVHHFIVRPEVVKRLPTGLAVEQSLVPLIPLDELPEWLDIVGVPRSLAPEQTTGLSNLGCYERQGIHDAEIIIDEPESDAGDDLTDDAVQRATAPPTNGAKPAIIANGTAEQPGLQNSRWADRVHDDGSPSKPDAQAPIPAARATHPADRMMAHVSPGTTTSSPCVTNQSHPLHSTSIPSLPTPKATSPTTSSPGKSPKPTTSTSPSEPPTKKRAYCRHWIHHGTCKWGPYCRFTHTMPATLPGLEEVGLRDFPSWWTAAMAALSLSPPPPTRKTSSYMRMNGMGGGMYGCGMPGGFMPYGAVGGFGGDGGYGGYGRREREVREREREVHPRETERGVRKMRVEAGVGNGGVVQGMRAMGGKTREIGNSSVNGVQAAAVAQAPAVVQGSGPVVLEKRREVLEEQIRQESQLQQVVPLQVQLQRKLVDV
jgi:hypothetical protein